MVTESTQLRRPHRSFHEDQGGIAHEAAVAFATVLLIAITWNVLFPSLQEHVFEYAENEYKQNDDFTDYKSTYNLIYYVVKYWPIILLVAVLLYLFMASQKPTRGSYRRV